MKTAIFPGSFDPITLGHKDIIEKSCKQISFIYKNGRKSFDNLPLCTRDGT